ncbi:hypothetical protein CHS0354_007081 [Potamilus streckersoni]|uniref:C2H2-type domain-containing protein n=1 Tax=Potamilus streckersoni TaxID=2493646 RepID=A0AAE0VKT5_9BIVA|nr:hypothetical protein CHS0354_007081 [Potamilus streckersoni]
MKLSIEYTLWKGWRRQHANYPHQTGALTGGGPEESTTTVDLDGRHDTDPMNVMPDSATVTAKIESEERGLVIQFSAKQCNCDICKVLGFSTLTHGASCHILKCPGAAKFHKTQISQARSYSCSECAVKCTTCIGLGKHIRHAHPILANAKGIEGIMKDADRKRMQDKKRVTMKMGVRNNKLHPRTITQILSLADTIQEKANGLETGSGK